MLPSSYVTWKDQGHWHQIMWDGIPALHLYHVGLGDHETSQMFFIHNVPRSRVCPHTHMHTLQIFVLSFHALLVPLLQVLHSLLSPDHVLYLLGSRKLVTVLMGRNVFEGKGCVLLPYIPRPSPASAIELMSIYYCWMKLYFSEDSTSSPVPSL